MSKYLIIFMALMPLCLHAENPLPEKTQLTFEESNSDKGGWKLQLFGNNGETTGHWMSKKTDIYNFFSKKGEFRFTPYFTNYLSLLKNGQKKEAVELFENQLRQILRRVKLLSEERLLCASGNGSVSFPVGTFLDEKSDAFAQAMTCKE